MRFFLLCFCLLAFSGFSQKISVKFYDQCGYKTDSIGAFVKIVSDYSEDSVFCIRREYSEGHLVRITNLKRSDSLVWNQNRTKSFKPLYKVAEVIFYKESGLKYAELKYLKSNLTDTLKLYYPNGKLKRWSFCRNDTVVSSRCFSESGGMLECPILLRDPEFPNGEDARVKYLGDNLVYPNDALRQGREGIVYLEFCVSSSGEIFDVRIKKSSGSADLDEEASRVVSSMPNWLPGIDCELAVNMTVVLPIRYQIPDEDNSNSRKKRKK